MTSPAIRLCFAGVALVVSTEVARAHVVAARLGDFYAGAFHPLTDLRDAILSIAIASLAAFRGVRSARWLIFAFPAGLVAGAATALELGVAITNPFVECTAIVVMGLALALAAPVPEAILWLAAFALGTARGAANVAELGLDTNATLFVAGLATIGYVSITLLMALAHFVLSPIAALGAEPRIIALRAFGSWIAALGLMMGALALGA